MLIPDRGASRVMYVATRKPAQSPVKQFRVQWFDTRSTTDMRTMNLVPPWAVHTLRCCSGSKDVEKRLCIFSAVERVIKDHQVYLLYRDDLATVSAGSA